MYFGCYSGCLHNLKPNLDGNLSRVAPAAAVVGAGVQHQSQHPGTSAASCNGITGLTDVSFDSIISFPRLQWPCTEVHTTAGLLLSGNKQHSPCSALG
jgi:hypothetical protein